MATSTTTSPTDPTQNGSLQNAELVPGSASTAGNINIADASGQIATNPNLLINSDNGTSLASQVPTISQDTVNQDSINDPSLTQGSASQYNANTATVGQTSTAQQQSETPASQYQASTSADQVAAQQMQAATGQVNQNDLVDTTNTGIDTSTYGQTTAGQALQQYAHQNTSNIIDTSTAAGKLLAAQLGDGNYVDSKATVEGQLAILQKEFVDPTTGQPTIPSWAAATARSVSRIAGFQGMTGTAATAAMSQALMEASLPIAQSDSQFYQTLTIDNLNNKQQSTINNANVLSKIDMANMDQRMTAAVDNAQSFMQMDMANLSNEQQAASINTQDRVQSILSDTNAKNVAKQFNAQSQQDQDQFYASLNSAIQQYNASQQNQMSQFNAGQTNSMSQFNSTQENNRDQFYKSMQYNVDSANAQWRQSVTMTQNQEQFNAAAQDVKAKTDLSTEMLNRIWDRSDALLDYAWKTADNEADRQNQINMIKIQAQQAVDQSTATGEGSLLGTLLGVGGNLLLKGFGF